MRLFFLDRELTAVEAEEEGGLFFREAVEPHLEKFLYYRKGVPYPRTTLTQDGLLIYRDLPFFYFSTSKPLLPEPIYLRDPMHKTVPPPPVLNSRVVEEALGNAYFIKYSNDPSLFFGKQASKKRCLKRIVSFLERSSLELSDFVLFTFTQDYSWTWEGEPTIGVISTDKSFRLVRAWAEQKTKFLKLNSILFARMGRVVTVNNGWLPVLRKLDEDRIEMLRIVPLPNLTPKNVQKLLKRVENEATAWGLP